MIKILLATLIGTVVYFLFGWLVFEGLLGKYMNATTTQIVGFKKTEAEFSMIMLVVSCAAYAGVFCSWEHLGLAANANHLR